MGIFDKCLFRYRARLLDTEGWFFAGYNDMIDEYRRSFIYTKGGNHNITIGGRTASSLWIQEHIRNLEQQYHLFIGYASDASDDIASKKTLKYPVYYNLRTGMTHIGTAYPKWEYSYRNEESNPILYQLVDTNPKDFFDLADYRLPLNKCILVDKTGKIPCKILAKLDVGSSDVIKEGVASLGYNDYLLVVCGLCIVVTTRRDIESQLIKGKINLLVDMQSDALVIDIVHLGQHNDMPESKKLSYSETYGLVYDYSNCQEIHAKGTIDCTPNAIINASSIVKCSRSAYYKTNLPCYTRAYLKDSKLPWTEFSDYCGRAFFYNLVELELPKDIKYTPDLVDLLSCQTASDYALPSLHTLVFPEALVQLPKGLTTLSIQDIVIPKGITGVTFGEDIPKTGTRIVFEAPRVTFRFNSNTVFINYKEIVCQDGTKDELYRLINELLNRGYSFSDIFPRLQKVNNIPIEEVILDISAERLLHGLSGVVV